MFKFLKEKLKSWTEKVSKKVEKVEKPEVSNKKLKKEKKKDIPVPMEFNAGMKQFQPDLEKIGEIQKEIEEEKVGTESFFKKITSRITKIKVSEKEFDIYAEDLEMLLLENNVALEVSEEIIRKLREKMVGKELLKKEIENEIKESLKEIIWEILVEPFNVVEKVKEKNKGKIPYIIL